MAMLSLQIVADSLDKIKKQFEDIEIGKNSADPKGGGSGGPSALGIGAAVSILDQLLKSTDSVVGILKIIGGLINQLVAPFVPILLGLIKPVFVLLQIFLRKILTTLGGGGLTEGPLAGIEQGMKLILASLAGVAAALLAKGLLAVAGIAGGIASIGVVLVGVATAALSIMLFDLGKKIGDSLAPIGNFLADVIISIDKFFGTNFKGVIIKLAQSIVTLFLGVADAFKALVNLDFKALGNIFLERLKALIVIFTTPFELVGNLLKLVFFSFVKGIKIIFEFLLSGVKNIITSFIGLFSRGLNALISILNKVPGVNLGSVSSGGNAGRSLQTTININVEGSADEKTVQATIQRMRAELNRRAAF